MDDFQELIHFLKGRNIDVNRIEEDKVCQFQIGHFKEQNLLFSLFSDIYKNDLLSLPQWKLLKRDIVIKILSSASTSKNSSFSVDDKSHLIYIELHKQWTEPS